VYWKTNCSLDFGSCQIRVLLVNDAPASFPVPTLETPEQGYAYSQEHIATSAWFTPGQECVTSILLNVRYAVIGWNLVSLLYGTASPVGGQDKATRNGEHLPRCMKPERLLSY
jgi:hypothetical protein